MHEHIACTLLPPLWGIVSEYLHDVELCMLAGLAIMPGGKYHKDPKNITMPRELAFAYEWTNEDGIIMPISDDVKSMASELIFIYESALHLCTNVIEWKHPQYPNFSTTALKFESGSENFNLSLALEVGAAISDNVEMLEWVQKKDHPYHWYVTVIRTAFKFRKNNSLKWLKDRIVDHAPGFETKAVLSDNLELLQWHRQLANKKDEDPCITASLLLFDAVRHGSPPMLDWLLAACGNSFDKDNPDRYWYIQAVRGGKSSNLEWLYKNGFCESASELYLELASSVDALQWLRRHGCQWKQNGAELYRYAQNGRIDLLEYAVDDGCPWTSNTYAGAALFNRLEVLQWGVAKKFPLNPAYLIDILNKNNAKNNTKTDRVLDWLREYQCANIK